MPEFFVYRFSFIAKGNQLWLRTRRTKDPHAPNSDCQLYDLCLYVKDIPNGGQSETITCGYSYRTRIGAETRKHNCSVIFKTIDELQTEFKVKLKDASSSTNAEILKTPKYLLADFITHTHISFRAASHDSLYRCVWAAMQEARKYPTVPVQQLFPTLGEHSLSSLVCLRNRILIEKQFERFKGKRVTLLLDGGVIGAKKYITLAMNSMEMQATPEFYSITKHSASSDEYSTLLFHTVNELSQKDISVRAICSDGLSAQLVGMSKMQAMLQSGDERNQKRFKSTPERYIPIIIPFHIYCYNHLTNLVIFHGVKDSTQLSKTKMEATIFATAQRKLHLAGKFSSRCPSFIETRWFTLKDIFAFARRHYAEIETDGSLLSSSSQMEFAQAECIIQPLIELHLFLETDTTKLCHVWPNALKCISRILALLLLPMFSSPIWYHSIVDIVVLLYNYLFSDARGRLMALAYALSPTGRESIRKNKFLMPLSALSACYSVDHASTNPTNSTQPSQMESSDNSPPTTPELSHTTETTTSAVAQSEAVQTKKEIQKPQKNTIVDYFMPSSREPIAEVGHVEQKMHDQADQHVESVGSITSQENNTFITEGTQYQTTSDDLSTMQAVRSIIGIVDPSATQNDLGESSETPVTIHHQSLQSTEINNILDFIEYLSRIPIVTSAAHSTGTIDDESDAEPSDEESLRKLIYRGRRRRRHRRSDQQSREDSSADDRNSSDEIAEESGSDVYEVDVATEWESDPLASAFKPVTTTSLSTESADMMITEENKKILRSQTMNHEMDQFILQKVLRKLVQDWTPLLEAAAKEYIATVMHYRMEDVGSSFRHCLLEYIHDETFDSLSTHNWTLFFEQISHKGGDWEAFVKFTQNLIYANCSEAFCERKFSAARHAVGLQRQNLTVEPLNAMLRS